MEEKMLLASLEELEAGAELLASTSAASIIAGFTSSVPLLGRKDKPKGTDQPHLRLVAREPEGVPHFGKLLTKLKKTTFLKWCLLKAIHILCSPNTDHVQGS